MTRVYRSIVKRSWSSWTVKQAEIVQALWLAGGNAREIGLKVGKSRHAVIGFCNRQGWIHGSGSPLESEPKPKRTKQKLNGTHCLQVVKGEQCRNNRVSNPRGLCSIHNAKWLNEHKREAVA